MPTPLCLKIAIYRFSSAFTIIILGLGIPQLTVFAVLLLNQLVVRTLLDNPPLMEDDDLQEASRWLM